MDDVLDDLSVMPAALGLFGTGHDRDRSTRTVEVRLPTRPGCDTGVVVLVEQIMDGMDFTTKISADGTPSDGTEYDAVMAIINKLV